ncbi:MAG: proton-conducting transporter membrane subunit, partial [Nitrosospira sp.]
MLALLPGRDDNVSRNLGNLFTTIALSLACYLLFNFDQHESGLQFSEYFSINPKVGSAYALGVDGLSLPMVALATLLTSIALLASSSITVSVKGYHISILLTEFGMLGVFLAQDWSLFYIFWEITLIPMFFLIDRWGGKRRQTASLNFVLYTMGGSIFMLVSLIAVYQYVPEHVSLMSAMGEV